MSIKPCWEERIKKANNEQSKPAVSVEKIEELLDSCLKDNGIEGKIIRFEDDVKKINYKEIMRNYETNEEGHLIWIEFVTSGHIAVVGAGKDIGFPRNKNVGTWRILSSLENAEWDETKVIVIPIKGLESIHRKKNGDYIKNILRCRDGIEYFIGDYLIDNDVPILNYYQHKNWSEEYWEECKKNNYIPDKRLWTNK